MKLKLHVWRQNGPNDKGRLETYDAPDVSPDQSFLEMLDDVNQALAKEGKDVIAFDHDCREGICGMCSQVINGVPHGGMERTTVCQLHMREFEDGDEIFIEPWKARAFPVIKDLVVDRNGLERIMQAGGYTSCHTGGVADANAILTGPDDAATQYFQTHTETALTARMQPIVSEATANAGVTAAYKRMLAGAGGLSSLLPADATDLDSYVTDKALDGLFLMVAEEERRIRENPLARSTDLLEKVFGSVSP